jgi:hypothetical protein
MKRIVTLLMAALLLAACQKEEPTTNPQPAPQPAVPSLAGTAWVGTLADTYQGYPMTITYNLDFADDSTGSLYVELLVNGITNPVDLTFHYTFDGDSGLLEGDDWNADFAYHAEGPTITTYIYMIDDQYGDTLGGEVTLYPRGEQPAPPVVDSFPANTEWSAQQVLDSGDTVTFALAFWDYGAGGSLTIRLLDHSVSTYIGWQYTPATARGTLTLSGHTVPFTYDAATDVIACVINGRIHFGDESVTVGGPLQFRR